MNAQNVGGEVLILSLFILLSVALQVLTGLISAPPPGSYAIITWKITDTSGYTYTDTYATRAILGQYPPEGYFTYTATIPDIPFKNPVLVLSHPGFSEVEVYLCGRRVAKVGNRNHSLIHNGVIVVPLEGTNCRTVSIKGYVTYRTGWVIPPFITDYKTASYYKYLNLLIGPFAHAVAVGINLAVGLMLLGLYFTTPAKYLGKHFLLFGISTIALAVFFIDGFVFPYMPISLLAERKLAVLSFSIAAILMHLAIMETAGVCKRSRHLQKIVHSITALLIILTLVSTTLGWDLRSFKLIYTMSVSGILLLLLADGTLLLYLLYGTPQLKGRERRTVLLLTGGILALGAFGLHEMVGMVLPLSSLSLRSTSTAFATMFIIVVIAYIMVEKFDYTVRNLATAQRERATLRQLVTKDPLTGALNRLYLSHVAKLGELSPPVSVLMLDLDNFKEINDSMGHMFGDRVLRQIADKIGEVIRNNDRIVRYGGDEFLILLNRTDIGKAEKIGRRILRTIEKTTSGMITASIGIAVCWDIDKLHEAIQLADKALYIAKSEGKNRVHSLSR